MRDKLRMKHSRRCARKKTQIVKRYLRENVFKPAAWMTGRTTIPRVQAIPSVCEWHISFSLSK